MDFDVIPYEDIVWGHRLGAGSFGSVFKGSYLGIDIAIKEVLPSTEYDVRKYFEREWRIMRECRHPNIVLFLGLAKALEDERVYIISEFVPRGNLRQFILSSHPFPWRLRLSFATDVARAVAYLHARQCIHRDLKGENLLITSNERVKVTDFGFARIASRNADEMKRMTYCGTDGYMSPEIINGQDFDLPTDVFSLGIIFVEVMSRRLVDSRTYIRKAPSFAPDPAEVRRRASPGCPSALVDLALQCCLENPTDRPVMAEVLTRLRAIEVEVLSGIGDAQGEHVGSVKLVNHGGKRAMPIFDRNPQTIEAELRQAKEESDDGEEEARTMEEDALVTLAKLDVGGGGASTAQEGDTWRTARWEERPSAISVYSDAREHLAGHERLLPSSDTTSSFSSTDTRTLSSSTSDVSAAELVQTASALFNATPADDDDPASSTMTVKGDTGTAPPSPQRRSLVLDEISQTTSTDLSPSAEGVLASHSDISSISSLPSELVTTEEQPTVLATKHQKALEEEKKDEAVRQPGSLGTHRFTLVSKDTVPLNNGKKASGFTSNFAFAFLQKSLAPRHTCPVCHKRLGQRLSLQCDDCPVLVHVKCSHAAPRDCIGGDGSAAVKAG